MDRALTEPLMVSSKILLVRLPWVGLTQTSQIKSSLLAITFYGYPSAIGEKLSVKKIHPKKVFC